MTKALQVFDYKGTQVRTVERDGEIWFVAKDVADILGFRYAYNATQCLEDNEKGTCKVSTPGGEQNMVIVNEPGLYRLIFRSNKPEAKLFQDWVYHDVLPILHHTGSYTITAPRISSEELEVRRMEAQNQSANLLQHIIDAPAIPLTAESKAVIQHEVFRIITGRECLSMLPAEREACTERKITNARVYAR